MMYFLCEYNFVMHHQPRTLWDRITGYMYTNSMSILIQANDKEEAEDKFMVYFNERHPGRKLRAWNINDTIV